MAGLNLDSAKKCRTCLRAAPWALVVLFATSAMAQLPAARMTGVFPPGGRTGTKFDVTVTGGDLDGAVELRFSRPGIRATPADGSESRAERKFTVAIGPDVPLGLCEVRFVGAFGISNPRTFAIGDVPESVRTPGTPGEPAPLAVGSVVNARSTARVVDSYTVDLKEGRRVLLECASGEIDSKMSPVMVLCDGASHEVERSRHGGLLDFTAPADGTYTLQVHDLLYRGGPDYFYRLRAGVGPHLDSIFPPAGVAGSKATYTFYGRNLPGGSASGLRAADGKPLDRLEVEIEMPSDVPSFRRLDAAARTGVGGWSADAFAYHLASENGSSNAILIGLTDRTPVLEREPNDDPAQAQKLQPPAEVVGRSYPHGDRDWFTFDADKGTAYWIEVFSQRMGLPSSPLVVMQRVTGNDKGVEKVSDVRELSGTDANVGGPPFRTSTRDGAFRFQAGEAGTYRLMVRDLFNTAIDNPALTYRLSIRRERPDFQILALPIVVPATPVPLWSPFLRQGGAVPVRLILLRQDGFDGDVHVDVEGLPAGVKCGGTTISAGQSTGTLVITSADHAADWCGPVRIVGRANVNHEDTERDARVGTVLWPGNPTGQDPAISRLAENFALAVSGEEQEPITFHVGDAAYEAGVGGKAKIAVKVRRNVPVNTPLKITFGGLGATTDAQEITLAPGASEGSIEIDVAKQKLSAGTYTFFLQAQAQVTYSRRSFPPPGKSGDAKKIPQNLQATCYSPPLTLNVVPRGKAKGE